VYGYWDEYSTRGQTEGGSGHLEDVPVHRETATEVYLVRFSGYLHSCAIGLAGVAQNR
jgi:hypothetical protein